MIDGRTAWIVESGSIALFSVEGTAESPEGNRDFLMRLDAGEAVLVGLSAEFAHFKLLAVAINKAEVQGVPLDALLDAAKNADPAAIVYVQKWISRLDIELIPPQSDARADITAALAVGEKTWLNAFESAREQKRQESRSRFLKKQALIENVTRQTLGELAAVLESGQRSVLPADGPLLLRAMQAVGQAQGINIRGAVFSDSRAEPIQAVLNASGIRARRVVLAGKWWKSDNGPLLGFLATSRSPVALLPAPRSSLSRPAYDLFNPADNTRSAVGLETAATLSGAAYVMYRPLNDQPGAFATLRFVLEGRGRDLAAILLTGVAATVLGMLTPQAISILVDQAIPDADYSLLIQLGLGLLTAAIASVLFEVAQAASILRIEIGSSSALQCGVWDRLLSLSPAFFRKYSTGDLASRAAAVNGIRQQLSGPALRTIFAGTISLLNLFLMFYYSPVLALASLLLVLIVVVVTAVSGTAMIRLIRPLQEVEGELYGLVVQLVTGAAKLQIAAAEERAFACWGRLYTRQQKLRLGLQKLEDRVRLVNVILPALSSALLFWLIEEWLRNPNNPSGLALGTFLAFTAAFGTFFAGVTSLSDTVFDLLNVKNLWHSSKLILDEPPEIDESKTHPGKLQGRIAVEHVTFRYRENGPLILEDVSIEAEPGESIALVGPSGSGKSTIFNLLLRFETPLSGAIYYDGQNLDSLDVSGVRRQIGVVLQENKITAGSIFENIVCGSLCTLEDAWEAARAAAFDADIEAMPMKMHTPVSEGGTNISGGQRQRLLIARALVTKPSILIFDEATSALDNRTQAIVAASLRRLKVTTVLIAHRLSTIRHANRIYVIEAGRVIQRGTFEELNRQDGLFARLMARQMA